MAPFPLPLLRRQGTYEEWIFLQLRAGHPTPVPARAHALHLSPVQHHVRWISSGHPGPYRWQPRTPHFERIVQDQIPPNAVKSVPVLALYHANATSPTPTSAAGVDEVDVGEPSAANVATTSERQKISRNIKVDQAFVNAIVSHLLRDNRISTLTAK